MNTSQCNIIIFVFNIIHRSIVLGRTVTLFETLLIAIAILPVSDGITVDHRSELLFVVPKDMNTNATKIHLHKFTCVSHKVKILNLVVFRAYFRPKETKPTVLK